MKTMGVSFALFAVFLPQPNDLRENASQSALNPSGSVVYTSAGREYSETHREVCQAPQNKSSVLSQDRIERLYDALPSSKRSASKRSRAMGRLFGLPANSPISEIGLESHGGLGFESTIVSIVIREDGSFEYLGKGSVTLEGSHSGRINRLTFGELRDFIISSGYMGMDNNYNNGPTDCSTVYSTVVMNGRRKVIRNYFNSGPSALWAVQELIMKTVVDAIRTADNPNTSN